MPSLTIKEIFDRTKKVTDHYIRTNGEWSPQEQIAHIHAEVSEVWYVLRNKDQRYGVGQTLINHFLEENSDVILTVVTLLQLVNSDPDEFERALERTIQKIEKRVEEKDV